MSPGSCRTRGRSVVTGVARMPRPLVRPKTNTTKSSCKTASLIFTSDSDSDLSVTLKMSIAGHADQAPRRRGRQSSRQERGPGSQAPPLPPLHPLRPLHHLHLPQPLPLQRQNLSPQGESGIGVPEPYSGTREDDSGKYSPASSLTC